MAQGALPSLKKKTQFKRKKARLLVSSEVRQSDQSF